MRGGRLLLWTTGLLLAGRLPAMDLLLPGDPFRDTVRLRLAEAGVDALTQPVPADTAVLELRAGLAAPGLWLEGGGEWRLARQLWARLWVMGGSDEDGESLLGTHTRRGGWTGRVAHATLSWEQENLQLEWGRRSLAAGQDRISELGWPVHVPPVDMFRLRLHTRDEHLSLELDGAQLGSTEDRELRRWYARHRVVWRPAGSRRLTLTCGDQVIFTGIQRGFDWSFLNPLVPFFLENFEGYSEVEHEQDADQDNSSLFATWDGWLPLGERTRLGSYGELLVDEFQIDGADRRNLDDALGLTLGFDLRRRLTADGVLRLRWEGSALSHWTYVHRGLETSFLEKGHVIGNEEGGDLHEQHVQLQWIKAGGRQGLLSLTVGRLVKGAITPTTEWAAEDTKDADWPLPAVTRSWVYSASGQLRLGPALALALAATRRTAEPGWTVQGRLGWTLQLNGAK
ncbi:MAG: hypothetical protein WC326_00625 [Candidatus Delongbacteria bacterium]